VDTLPLSPDEIRAAAEVHRELGPQYSDAVVQSFLDKIDKEVEARIEARIAALPPRRRAQPEPSVRARRRAFLAGTAAGLAGAGIPLAALAEHLAHESYGSQAPLMAISIVIAVIIVAIVAGLTGAVTIRIASPRKRPARPAPIASGQEGHQAT
jgi:hypothetical protein